MALRDQPYIPLYVTDFMTDEKLVECSAESTGVYIRLMCIMHKMDNYGVITLKAKDKQNIKQNAKQAESNPTSTIRNFAVKLPRQMPYTAEVIERSLSELIEEGVLQLDGDSLYQKRMVRDGELSQRRAKAGRKGGKTSQNSTDSLENHQPQSESSSDSTSKSASKTSSKPQSKTQANAENEIENVNVNEIKDETKKEKGGQGGERKKKTTPVQERWELFWKAYPKKQGKGAAEKAFLKISPSGELFALMMQKLEQAKVSRQWQKDGGDYIPNPATWLNQKRWEDDYGPAQQPQGQSGGGNVFLELLREEEEKNRGQSGDDEDYVTLEDSLPPVL